MHRFLSAASQPHDVKMDYWSHTPLKAINDAERSYRG